MYLSLLNEKQKESFMDLAYLLSSVDGDFSDEEPLPIGFPCENTRLYLIDGEICVGGT